MEDDWKFYGRADELAQIEQILSGGRWFFCSISGRRRIGKTSLIQRALVQMAPSAAPARRHFYFQVPDSDERGVVQAFQDALEDYGANIEQVRTLRTFLDMALYIPTLCAHGYTVIIDEFQYFHRQALSQFTSHLQAQVDRLRDTRSGGIFVLGSIHTEMTAILEDRSSPLFNRVSHRLNLQHWDFQTIFEMFDAHGVRDEGHQLFLWSLFEGVPKFYRDCFEQGLLRPAAELDAPEGHRRATLRRLFFEGSSPLRDEAANWFLRELRGRYDSVLKILARQGACSLAELRSEYGRAGSESDLKQLGAYLTTLTDRYQMVEKLQPVFAGRAGRKGRYTITDNFLAAWLRALARNVQMARVQPVALPVGRADQLLMDYEGHAFEKMVRLLTEECSRKGVGDFLLTDLVRGYWNKADREDIEIDLVALNDEDRVVRFGSCKRTATAHDGSALGRFDQHVERFLRTSEGGRLAGWRVERALYATRFDGTQRRHLEGMGYVCRDIADFRRFLNPTFGQQPTLL